jgi:hemolysin activation/secretion protein
MQFTHMKLCNLRSYQAVIALIGRWLAVWVSCFSLLISTSLYAQKAPDVGAMEQQIQQGRRIDLPKLLIQPEPAIRSEKTPVTEGFAITVKLFELVGSDLLTSAQIKSATEPFTNRPIGMSDLQEAADALASAFRGAGWVVRTYVPEQDFVDGKVTIRAEVAVLGKIEFQGQKSQRLPLKMIEDVIGKAVQVGQPIRFDALSRALLLADDLVGVTVSGLLREGEKPGQTDLVLSVADEPAKFGEGAFDNWGSRSTGATRVSANFNGNSLLGLGDLTTVSAITTPGSTYMRLGITLPLGHDGFRVGANASEMRYRVITSEFSAYRGEAASSGVDASYPLVRYQRYNLYAKAAADIKTLSNYNGDLLNSANTNKVGTIGLSGNLFDSWLGGGASSGAINYYRGSIDVNDAAVLGASGAVQRSAGTYSKWRYNVSRQQELSPQLTLFVSGSGQRASRNLDSSEKFYLGGSSGVRAYPNSEGGGDNGQMASIELRWRALPGLVVTGFVDAGRITINQDNNFVGASALNSYHLAGKGMALSWQASRDLILKSSVSQRIGRNPNPTATGNDQDGSLVKNRWWLSATLSF